MTVPAPRDESVSPAASDGPGVTPLERAIEQSDNALVKRLDRPVKQATRITRWVQRQKIYRVVMNYNLNDGNLLASGMSFQSLFAVFAALVVVFSVAGIWLTSNAAIYSALVDIIDRAIPGLIGPGGLINTDDLLGLGLYGWTGTVALVGLLWTAISWLAYTRQAIRSVFSLPRDSRPYLLQKVVDLGLALVFGVMLFASAVFSVLSTQAVTWLLFIVGVDSNSGVSTVAAGAIGLLVAVMVNLITIGSMYRILSRIPIPWRDLAGGALIGSIALSALSVFSGWVIQAASRNPLLATFAVFIGLLIWFNAICRIILLAASWIAVGVEDKGVQLHRMSRAERLDAERRARLVVAEAELRDARDEYEHASWMSRPLSRRRLRQAHREWQAARDALAEASPNGSPVGTASARTTGRTGVGGPL